MLQKNSVTFGFGKFTKIIDSYFTKTQRPPLFGILNIKSLKSYIFYCFIDTKQIYFFKKVNFDIELLLLMHSFRFSQVKCCGGSKYKAMIPFWHLGHPLSFAIVW